MTIERMVAEDIADEDEIENKEEFDDYGNRIDADDYKDEEFDWKRDGYEVEFDEGWYSVDYVKGDEAA